MFKVPQKTSIWETRPINPRGTMYFAQELMGYVKNRKKHTTYRFGTKYNYLKTGDKITIKENGKEDTSYHATILSIRKTTFANLPLQNPGHETPRNKEHQRQILSGYYAFLGRPIADSDPFLIIEFELI